MNSLKTKLKPYVFDILCFIVITVFVFFKITQADLPYFIDEGWSYGNAIYRMTNNGPSVLPGSISPTESRGHPLLFYFLASLWLKISGYSIVKAHLFSIFISSLYLISVFYFGKRFYGTAVAFVTFMLIILQPAIQAQSALLLPEIMMSFFIICMFYSYLINNIFLFNLFATLLIFTKETGITAWLAVFIFELIFRTTKPTGKFFLRQIKLFAIPTVLIGTFFILQKMKFGWFLFPDHLGLIETNIHTLYDRMMRIVNFLVHRQGRYIISLLTLIPLFLLIRQKKLWQQFSEANILNLLFIVIYILIMSFNFNTSRYTILVFASYFVIITSVFYRAFEVQKQFFWLFSFICMITSVIHIFTERSPRDVNYGYMDDVIVNREAIRYMEQHDLYDKHIAASYLMPYNMTNPEAGYLSGNRIFTNITVVVDSLTEYIVIINQDTSILNSDISDYHLIKNFTRNKAFCRIYQHDK